MNYTYITISLLLFSATLFGQEERKHIRQGTTNYNEEKYLESEIDYRKALDKEANSYEAQFNIGDALYKQKKYPEAADQFQILASTEKDKQRLASIYHNLGNSYFAMNKLDKSIEAYKNSLRNNPEDHETRYNLIAALKKRKQQQDQQQKQDQNKDQQNQNKDQNKQQQQDQQQQDQDQDGIPDEKEKEGKTLKSHKTPIMMEHRTTKIRIQIMTVFPTNRKLVQIHKSRRIPIKTGHLIIVT